MVLGKARAASFHEDELATVRVYPRAFKFFSVRQLFSHTRNYFRLPISKQRYA
jgi:hypothetical protein